MGRAPTADIGHVVLNGDRSRRWAVSAAGAIVVLGVYLPLALERSAWSDDFPIFLEGEVDGAYRYFRPLMGLAFELGSDLVNTIDGLRAVRVIGVLGVAAFVGVVIWHLHRWGTTLATAFLVGVSVGFLPPFHGFAGWATTFFGGWLLMLAGYSSLAGVDGILDRRPRLIVAGALGQAASLLFYPPLAMFGWGFVAMRSLVCRLRLQRSLREMAAFGLLLGVVGTLTLVVGRLAHFLLDAEFVGGNRLITSAPQAIDKIVWFITHPVGVVARPFIIASPGNLEAFATAGPMLVFVAVGLYMRQQGSNLERIGSLLALGLAAVLTMLFHLIAIDNQIEYRFMTGLTVIFWIYCVFAAREIGSKIEINIETTRGKDVTLVPKIGLAILTIVVVVSGGLAYKNIDQVFVEPSRVKELFLMAALEDYDPDSYERIIVINGDGIWPSRENLGIYSTRSDLSHPWVPESNVRQLLRETGRWRSDGIIDVVRGPSRVQAGDYVVDLRLFARQL